MIVFMIRSIVRSIVLSVVTTVGGHKCRGTFTEAIEISEVIDID